MLFLNRQNHILLQENRHEVKRCIRIYSQIFWAMYFFFYFKCAVWTLYLDFRDKADTHINTSLKEAGFHCSPQGYTDGPYVLTFDFFGGGGGISPLLTQFIWPSKLVLSTHIFRLNSWLIIQMLYLNVYKNVKCNLTSSGFKIHMQMLDFLTLPFFQHMLKQSESERKMNIFSPVNHYVNQRSSATNFFQHGVPCCNYMLGLKMQMATITCNHRVYFSLVTLLSCRKYLMMTLRIIKTWAGEGRTRKERRGK